MYAAAVTGMWDSLGWWDIVLVGGTDSWLAIVHQPRCQKSALGRWRLFHAESSPPPHVCPSTKVYKGRNVENSEMTNVILLNLYHPFMWSVSKRWRVQVRNRLSLLTLYKLVRWSGRIILWRQIMVWQCYIEPILWSDSVIWNQYCGLTVLYRTNTVVWQWNIEPLLRFDSAI